MDQVRKSVVQDGGGVSGRHPVSITLKTKRAIANRIFLFVDDIIYLQIGLIVYYQYKNVNERDNVTTIKTILFSVTENLLSGMKNSRRYRNFGSFNNSYLVELV